MTSLGFCEDRDHRNDLSTLTSRRRLRAATASSASGARIPCQTDSVDLCLPEEARPAVDESD